MQLRWKVYGKIYGFGYSFLDYVIKGYSSQYHVQVASVIQLDAKTVQDCHPAENKIVIQSDNAIGFASQELIPFVFNMITGLHIEKKWF